MAFFFYSKEKRKGCVFVSYFLNFFLLIKLLFYSGLVKKKDNQFNWLEYIRHHNDEEETAGIEVFLNSFNKAIVLISSCSIHINLFLMLFSISSSCIFIRFVKLIVLIFVRYLFNFILQVKRYKNFYFQTKRCLKA
ncbi:hypothetical protein EDC94DRAFT_301018 [Helicostylum pulchrum]|nr:hypothetical protein EDC94DRAFT_301018 [Helicostylum pulchrum]